MPSASTKTRSPEGEGRQAAARLLAMVAALLVVTCSLARRPGAAPGAPPGEAATPGIQRRPATLPDVATPAAASAGSPAPVVSAARGEGPAELRRFRASLSRLASGERRLPVRILWLGDSHTAADFLPDAVRRPLSARARPGGPGFLYLGVPLYRHADVKVTQEGEWRVSPRRPALTALQDDGVFGLGGLRVTPAGSESRVTVQLSRGTIRGEARWELAYRLRSPRDRLTVAVSGGETLEATGQGDHPGSIRHLTWLTPRDAAVTLKSQGGEPQIFGVVVEDTEPGVVIDTLGINGARLGTPLAWEAGSWTQEARRRAPDLAVLAYGTNEVGDQRAPSRYRGELEALVARVRMAAPDADCLIMGPTDRAGPEWTSLPRVREIEAVQREVAEHEGCAFFGAASVMGGDGGIKRWADQVPPLAARDRVHLTARGYAVLGASLATLLVGELIPPELP